VARLFALIAVRPVLLLVIAALAAMAIGGFFDGPHHALHGQ
jgi:hypothetical protein